MALRFGIGGVGRYFRFLRPQLGIRGSLFAAFAVIAGMTIVISAGAGMVFRHLGGTMVDLSGRDIPRLAASLQLAAESASLSSQGPALLASPNAEALGERAKKMKETQQVALARLGEVVELGADKTVVAALGETVKNIDDTITSLDSAARERLEAAAVHDQQFKALREAQAGFAAAANPAMLDAQAQTNAILQSANFSPDDAANAARQIEQLGTLIATTNLVASEMAAALSANSSNTLEEIETEYKAAQAQVKSSLESLPEGATTTALRNAALKLLALGEGKMRV